MARGATPDDEIDSIDVYTSVYGIKSAPFLVAWLISYPYVAFMALGLSEYALHQATMFPSWESKVPATVGIIMVMVGEGIRKTGMVTCASGFTHKIQFQRRAGHTLTTDGIYQYMRHPGYAGWVIWCVGTQITLRNIVSPIIFLIVSWKFMKERIAVEDALLRSFFGEEWVKWWQKVHSGIPGIR